MKISFDVLEEDSIKIGKRSLTTDISSRCYLKSYIKYTQSEANDTEMAHPDFLNDTQRVDRTFLKLHGFNYRVLKSYLGFIKGLV